MYQAQVKWGDGQQSSTATHNVTIQPDPTNSGVFDIVATKPTPYREEAKALTFSVSLTGHGFTAAQSATISVADAALTLILIPPAPTAGKAILKVLVGTFTDANPLGSLSDFTAAVAWGDGQISSSPTTVVIRADPKHKGVFDILATKPKPYTQPATGLTFMVTVTDKGGSKDSKSDTIDVG